jgi:VanZ family protein
MEAGDRPRAEDERDVASSRRRAAAWAAGAWLLAIIVLSAIATLRPRLLLQVTHYIPGRDKTGHFLLMGGFGGVSVLAFAGRRVGTRRVPVLGVLAVVALFVVLEEVVQRWLPNRTFSLLDIAASLSGVACFGALAAAWLAREARSDC